MGQTKNFQVLPPRYDTDYQEISHSDYLWPRNYNTTSITSIFLTRILK